MFDINIYDDMNLNIFLKGKDIPQIVIDSLDLIQVKHYNFQNQIVTGFIVCNKNISNDLKLVFDDLLKLKFPINSVIPVSEFNWDDMESVKHNNSSCFNYRFVIGSTSVSDHATGSAIDINRFQNPWVHPNAHKIEGRVYDKKQIGTINDEVVNIFKKYGFGWGGELKNPDYQHFFKQDLELKKKILEIKKD